MASRSLRLSGILLAEYRACISSSGRLHQHITAHFCPLTFRTPYSTLNRIEGCTAPLSSRTIFSRGFSTTRLHARPKLRRPCYKLKRASTLPQPHFTSPSTLSLSVTCYACLSISKAPHRSAEHATTFASISTRASPYLTSAHHSRLQNKQHTTMAPAQRPFFSNFFAAFRARTNPTFQAKSVPTVGSPTSTLSPTSHHHHHHHTSSHAVTTSATASQPRTITTTKSSPTSDTTQQTIHNSTASRNTPFSPTAPTRYAAQPLSRSPGTSSPLSGPHPNPNLSMSPTSGGGGGASTPLSRGRQRRGSDSSNSSGGFMDALGPEKWYVGGRTAGGEETFYRLGLVNGRGTEGKRVRSLDRLSL